MSLGKTLTSHRLQNTVFKTLYFKRGHYREFTKKKLCLLFLIGLIHSSICTSSSWIAPSVITSKTGLRLSLIDSSVMETDQVCTFSCGCPGTLKLSKYVLELTARPFSNTITGSSQEQFQILSATIQFFNYLSYICISG